MSEFDKAIRRIITAQGLIARAQDELTAALDEDQAARRALFAVVMYAEPGFYQTLTQDQICQALGVIPAGALRDRLIKQLEITK